MIRDLENLTKALNEKQPSEYITELHKELKENWGLLKTAHDNVMNHVKEEDEEKEEQWMDNIRNEYNEVRKSLCKKPARMEKRPLQLKKMEAPKFLGDVKLYSRFKDDFNKFVKPATHPDQLAFTLRQSLGDEPLRVVAPAKNDIEKYGNASMRDMGQGQNW